MTTAQFPITRLRAQFPSLALEDRGCRRIYFDNPAGTQVPQAVIDVIKHRRSTAGIDETDALVIELGRQIWRDHKVTPETFAKAKAVFGANTLIDLVMLMGNYAGTAALLTAVDMQLHPGKKPLLPIP